MATTNKKFLDLEGLTYYNNKITSKINTEKAERVSADNSLQSQISGLASGAPLVASSTAEMTDTTKIYVNTTDGNWYYWDGDSWEVGGVYQASVDPDDIATLYNIVLTPFTNPTYYPTISDFIIYTDRYFDNTVGNTLPGSASQNWQAARFNVSAGDYYRVDTTVYGTSVHCAVFADADNKVISRDLVNTSTTNADVSEVFQAPTGAVYLYVNKHSPEDGDVGIVYKKDWEVYLENIENDIDALENDVEELQIALGDEDPFGIVEAKRPTILFYNKNNKNLNFAFITDTHCNGYYGGEKADKNSKLFAKIANEKFVDFAAFGGDLYSAYNLDYSDGVNAASEMIRYIEDMHTLLLPVKGNHDSNSKYMALADMSDLDWEHNTYYIYSNADHGYVVVTENEWDGETPLHEGTFPDATQAFSSTEYYTLMQTRAQDYVVKDTDNPYRAWYYKDFNEYKIRVIVLDAFDKGDSETVAIHGPQLKWFAEKALDLTNKPTPSQWEVLILSHYYSKANNDYTNKFQAVTDAFMAGGSVSGTLNQVSYSANYAPQGNGTIIAMIHGHQHADTYSNAYGGFNHIGVTRGYAKVDEQGTANEYAIDVFTVDKANKVLYETRIGGRGNSRSFQYGDNPQQLS